MRGVLVDVERDLRTRLRGEARTPEEIRDAVYLFTGDVGAKQSRFWLLLVLSAAVATFGIISDSTAAVIGAMIIAPLATPIQGVAVGVAYGERDPLVQSTLVVLGAASVVVALGALLSVVMPELSPLSENSQVTSRVSPTLVDLAAAAATGLAGAFAIARRDIGDILPGVAIAISLVPPLAVVGVTVAAGDWHHALGALLLFGTNVLAMIVVGALLFLTIGLVRDRRMTTTHELRPVYAVLAVSSFVVVLALSAATYRVVQVHQWQTSAQQIGGAWAKRQKEQLVRAQYRGKTMAFVVVGSSDGALDRELPGLLEGSIPEGTEVRIERIAGGFVEPGSVPG